MLLKTCLSTLWLVGSYLALVFGATSWWSALGCAISLAFAVAGFGFNVQHDGNHAASARWPWVNRLMGYGIDLVGGASYFWRIKHNVVHHTFTNVTGVDDDIFMGGLARLSPHDERRAFHRWQQLYMWGLYAMLLLKWHLVDDFRLLVSPRIGGRAIARPRGRDLAGFILGKAVFFFFAIVLPLTRHPWPTVVGVYVGTTALVGLILGVVFQLAHCVEAAHFVEAPAGRPRLGDWTSHQIATTVDFAPDSRVLAWYLGGLNFQIEHHLFPKISHVHYPALAPLVREVAARFGVRHFSHPTMRAALASHYRHLRQLGRADVVTANERQMAA